MKTNSYSMQIAATTWFSLRRTTRKLLMVILTNMMTVGCTGVL